MDKNELIAERGNTCEMCGRAEFIGNPVNLEIFQINPPSEAPEDLKLYCTCCREMAYYKRRVN